MTESWKRSTSDEVRDAARATALRKPWHYRRYADTLLLIFALPLLLTRQIAYQTALDVWIADLLCHFPLHYTAAALVVLAFAWYWRARWAMAGALLAMVVNVIPVLALFQEPVRPDAVDEERLRICCFNVLHTNTRHDEIIEYLRSLNDHDVVILLEPSPALFAAITEAKDFPFKQLEGTRRLLPEHRSSGSLVLVRYNMPAAKVLYRRQISTPSVQLTLQLSSQDVHLLSTHPPPPLTPSSMKTRNAQLAFIGSHWAGLTDEPRVVIGDFNTTSFSPAWQLVVEPEGFVNSQRGFGYAGTWPDSFLPSPMQIPIDHCVHTPDLVTTKRWLGPSIGSDHRALHVELAMAKNNE